MPSRLGLALIIVSHDVHYLRDHCQRAAVLEQGVLTHFPDVAGALDRHLQTMAV